MNESNEGNMNLDNPVDARELNMQVKNYTMIEFVAIPPDFDISNYLTLREQAGIFECKGIELDQVKKIAEAIKFSPVLALMNNALLKPEIGIYLLSVLNELGLVLNSIPNPLRLDRQDYKSFIDRYYENSKHRHSTYIRGQDIIHLNIILVNIFPMMDESIINEALDIANKLQEYQTEVNEKLKKISIID